MARPRSTRPASRIDDALLDLLHAYLTAAPRREPAAPCRT
jgi:hypothetical protein